MQINIWRIGRIGFPCQRCFNQTRLFLSVVLFFLLQPSTYPTNPTQSGDSWLYIHSRHRRRCSFCNRSLLNGGFRKGLSAKSVCGLGYAVHAVCKQSRADTQRWSRVSRLTEPFPRSPDSHKANRSTVCLTVQQDEFIATSSFAPLHIPPRTGRTDIKRDHISNKQIVIRAHPKTVEQSRKLLSNKSLTGGGVRKSAQRTTTNERWGGWVSEKGRNQYWKPLLDRVWWWGTREIVVFDFVWI